MKRFWKKEPFVLYHIDRIEHFYGNVMIRGWVVNRDRSGQLMITVEDAEGNQIPVYMERLVRPDVNQTWGEAAEYESGIHILIDRAVLDTDWVWLVFTNGAAKKKVRVSIGRKNALMRVFSGKQEISEMDYDAWVRSKKPDRSQRKTQNAAEFAVQPLFSVVIPLYNTPAVFLKEIIDSVMNQTYGKVELCLADGSTNETAREFIHKHYAKERRIRYCRLKQNRGISNNTNAALKMAKGDFVLFADHDDVLALDALYEMVRAINADPKIDMIYTDEDKINRKGTAYFGPHFKPDFDRELICCNNYFCHLLAVRRDVLKQVGWLDPQYDGAQDYDYVLRCTEHAKHIHHIPKVLYHWRTHPDSTAGNPTSKMYAFEAGRKALEAHYKRMGIQAAAENTEMLGRYRTRRAIMGEPLVTILIPNKDHVEDLQRCITSICEKSTYQNIEILIVENNSTEAETAQFYEELTKQNTRCKVIHYEGDFNYAAIHNFAVPKAAGEYVILLNNDTEVISENWIEELLGVCQTSDVGAVGAKLYYPDGTIQHAGVVLGLCGVASHLLVGVPGDKDGYVGRLVSVQEYSAVTAACMMTRKSAFLAVHGMEEKLAVSYNDIDYCLRLREAGYHIVFTPYAELTHYESKTRGLEDTEEKRQRLQREAEIFTQKWKTVLDAGDPFYNPNLSLTRTDCSLYMEQR